VELLVIPGKITSHGEDGSSPRGPLYPRNNAKNIDYTTSIIISVVLAVDRRSIRKCLKITRSRSAGKSSESVQLAMLKACDACADMGQ